MAVKKKVARPRHPPKIDPEETVVEHVSLSTQDVVHAVGAVNRAREDLKYFFLLFKDSVNDTPEEPYLMGDVHRELCKLVTDTVNIAGHHKLHAVSMPPQHGKSTILTMITVAWLVGRHSGIQIGISAYSHRLVCAFSMKIKEVLEHPLYKEVFPGVEISQKLNQREEWLTTNGSKVIARARGVKFTGHKLDYLIVDDPHSGREDAESVTKRAIVKDWFLADCLTRLSPGAKAFIIMTRWHPEDLIGALTEDEYVNGLIEAGRSDKLFQIHNYEAICTDKDLDPLHRDVGAALFPEYKDAAFLMGMEAQLPDYEWSSQFQGKPKPAGAGMVDVSKIKLISEKEIPKGLLWVRGWDLALDEKQSSDFSCGALCALDPETRELYLIHMGVYKLAWPRMKNRLINTSMEDFNDHNVSLIGFENVSGFEIGRREVKAALEGTVRVVGFNPTGKGSKLARAMPWLNIVEAGNFHMVKGGWNKAFLKELEYFPEAEHDDQIDSVSIAYYTSMKRGKALIA